jgi:hypothetical protein
MWPQSRHRDVDGQGSATYCVDVADAYLKVQFNSAGFYRKMFQSHNLYLRAGRRKPKLVTDKDGVARKTKKIVNVRQWILATSLGVLMLAIGVRTASAEQWVRHTIDDSSQGADGVRLKDVNGDGLLDIAVGWEEGGVVRVYLHPGREKVRQEWPAVTVGNVKSPEDAVFADLDGDGAVDVVSSCEGRTRSMFVHWAPAKDADYLKAEQWTTEAVPVTADRQMWMYALPMQIDGQHGIDLITGSKGKGGSVGWLQGPPNPRDMKSWRWHKLQDAGWIMSLIAADMDDDGDLDILVSDRKGAKRGVYWLEYPGADAATNGKSWKRHDVGGSNREILFVSLGDLDQDGNQDIIAIAKDAVVWYRANKSTWQEFVIPLPDGVGTGKSAAVFDADGDGRNDIVFSCEHADGALSGMRWLAWTTSPTTGPWTSHEIGGPRGVKYDRIVLHDVDGDGDLDVLCCEERDQLGVFWYENPF